MKLTKNEIDILHWHLRRYIRAHQPDHPRELDHFNRFYKIDKLAAICERIEKEKSTEASVNDKTLCAFYRQRED